MNGQNRPLPSTILPSGLTGSAISTNSHGPGQVDPALAITTNSWLRDMIADPARAAQVGVLNPFQSTNSPNHLLRAPGFDGNSAVSGMHIRPPRSFNPALMQGLYNGAAAALGPMLPSLPPGMTGQRSQDNLNVSNSSSSSEGRRAAPATVTLANNNTAQHPIFTQPYKRESAATPMSELEIPAKRLKSASVDAAPQSQRVAESSGASDSIPHRPEYFHCGSVVQLTENKLKRIEDLQTHDFESCAQLSPNLSLDCSTLIKIREDITRGTMFLTFSVGDKEQKPVEVTVEATLEHPFFVFDQGWSSVNPGKTFRYYQMQCHQLKVNDRCISLTYKDDVSINPTQGGAAVDSRHITGASYDAPNQRK